MTQIIDMTSTRVGLEERILTAVLDACQMTEDKTPLVLALPAHTDGVARVAAAYGAEFDTLPDGLDEERLVTAISKPIASAIENGGSVDLYSFSPAVRRLATTWNTVRPGSVRFTALAQFARQAGRWDSSLMPEEEAAAAVVRAIASISGGAVQKTDLRPLLGVVDKRLSKAAGGFAAAPGFITTLVGLAEARGLVASLGEEPSMILKLTDAGRQFAATNASSVSVADMTTVDVAQMQDAVVTRSDAFVSAWRAANLGPFMAVRTKVYAEIDRALEHEPRKLKSLVREAVRVVRESDTSCGEKFPWSRVTQFVENLMRRRPVALSDGATVGPNWTTGDRVVTEMVDGWQLLLDGELVLHLIDNGQEIRWDDLPDLAGALYNGRGEAETERAFDVVRRLADEGLVSAESPDLPLRRVEEARGSLEISGSGAQTPNGTQAARSVSNHNSSSTLPSSVSLPDEAASPEPIVPQESPRGHEAG
jgi:hypothetical protein